MCRRAWYELLWDVKAGWHFIRALEWAGGTSHTVYENKHVQCRHGNVSGFCLRKASILKAVHHACRADDQVNNMLGQNQSDLIHEVKIRATWFRTDSWNVLCFKTLKKNTNIWINNCLSNKCQNITVNGKHNEIWKSFTVVSRVLGQVIDTLCFY